MTAPKMQSLAELEAEMRAVARGERPAPPDAAAPSFDSVETLIRLLTPENRRLLRVIRDERPESVADLARRTGRAEPNLLRTLAKLEALGLVELRTINRRKVPSARVTKLRVEIDPYGARDRVELA